MIFKTLQKISTICIFLFSVVIFSQDFQGVATYKSHRKVDLKIGGDDMDSVMKKQIQEQLKKQFQREYTLKFTKSESVYTQNEELAAPAPASGGFQITVNQGSDVMYKNIKENRYVNQTEIHGKRFLIQDSLKKRAWKVTSDTKNIGDYTCYKAEFTEEVENRTFKDGTLETVKENQTTTVWFTPQIPVSNGPEDYFGLPGLILEINDGKLTLVCTKIVINPEKTVEIVEPDKGKQVSQEKFDEIMDKKTKEMMEQFKGRKGKSKGDKQVIMIGG